MRSAPGWVEIPTTNANFAFQFQDATMAIFPDGSWRCVAPHRLVESVATGELATLEEFLKEFAAANPL
jgi:hypothetical protein